MTLVGEDLLLRKKTLAGIIIASILLSAVGCANPLHKIERELVNGNQNVGAEALQLGLGDINLGTLPPAALTPSWQRNFADYFAASLSPDGNLVAAFTLIGNASGTTQGFNVFDQQGNLLWNHTFKDEAYKSGWAKIMGPNNQIIAGAFHYNNMGSIYCFDAFGNQLWNKPVWGPTTVVHSRDGTRFGLVDSTRGVVQLVNKDGTSVGAYTIRGQAKAEFFSRGNALLLQDADRIRIIGPDGERIWETEGLSADLCQEVELAHGGDLVAISTDDADGSLYLFDISGNKLWEYLLFFGGSQQLTFSPDDARLAAYDVGERAGIYVFDCQTGKLLWRHFFSAEENIDVDIRSAQFSVDGEILWALTVESGVAEDGKERYHLLVFAGDNGQLLQAYTLGENVEVHVAGSGTAMIVGSHDIGKKLSHISNRLAYYELDFANLN
jgi:hypothetical protein